MKHGGAILLVLSCLFAFPVRRVAADDWPMWRGNARHTASCDEQLPDQLHLQWSRELPPTLLAWPNEPRLHFDATYEPVAAGTRLLVSSPNEGSLTAYDTQTGQSRWKFFAEGPLRFAPVVWQDKVFVGSDDGWLYCLGLGDGALRSRIRGAPADRLERRQLGNHRLISFWPVRGGPVLADGTVYFAAGIWPTMGVFVVAVDAASEQEVWRNDGLGFLDRVRLDHNALQPSGLSPQGYLAVEGDLLLVPNGRSMPAGLDRKTGQLRWYVQGYRNGDCRVAVSEPYALVGNSGIVDLRTGREVGSRWAAAGTDAPAAFDLRKFHLFEGPAHPYKMFSGCSGRSALASGKAYDLESGVLVAHHLAAAATVEYDVEFQGYQLKPWRWEPPVLWKLPTDLAAAKPAESSLIRAGRRLYGHTAGKLMAVDLPSDATAQPTLAWTQDLPGKPANLLAADGKLFVVTREGRLCCFGGQQVQPQTHRSPTVPLASAQDAWTRQAGEMLQVTGITAGYCVVLGNPTGRLIEELLRQSNLKIIGVDPHRQRIDALRQRLIDAGLYPHRAELFVGSPSEFSLPPYLASLVVAEGDLPGGVGLELLRPYGGTLCAMAADPVASSLAGVARQANLDFRQTEKYVLVQRSKPLADSAAWTHESADAARSYFSHDRRVKSPLGILWYGDGPDYGFWKEKDYGTGVKPQVVGGRVFALQISSRTLFAYDAFTGRRLWTSAVSPFTRYASLEDGLYVAGDNRCRVLDPATGQERASWPFEIEGGRPAFVADIRVSAADNVVLIAAAPDKVREIEKGLWDSTTLIALDRLTGQLLWKRHAQLRFNNNALASGAGSVFCVDSRSPIQMDKESRQGDAPEQQPSTVFAIEARTGRVRWSQTTMHPFRTYGVGSWLGIQGRDDWLAYAEEAGLLLTGKLGTARGYEGTTGKEIWSQPVGSQPLLLRGTTFVNQEGQIFETRTGQRSAGPLRLNRAGCNYAVASEHLFLLRDQSVSYLDVDTQAKQSLYAVRSGCSNSLVAADGVLSVPNFAVGCICNYPIQTSFAMVHMPEAAAWLPAAAGAAAATGAK